MLLSLHVLCLKGIRSSDYVLICTWIYENYFVVPSKSCTRKHLILLKLAVLRKALIVTSLCCAHLVESSQLCSLVQSRKNLELSMIHWYLQLGIFFYVLLSVFCSTPCLLSHVFMASPLHSPSQYFIVEILWLAQHCCKGVLKLIKLQ